MARTTSNATTWECVRTYHVDSDVEPGDSIRYGSWSDRPYDGSQPFNLITLATFGDYDNSCEIERSNRRALLADSAIEPHLVHVHGGHGTEGVGYLGTEPPCTELHEALDSMDTYPILDEQDCSELETDMESEAWSDYGRQDFMRALVEVINALDPAYEHEQDSIDLALGDSAFSLWRDGCDAYNVNGGNGYKIESGASVYFYIKEWIEDCQQSEDARWPWSDYVRGARAKLDEQLQALAESTRGALIPNVEPELDLAIEAFTIACTRLLACVPSWEPRESTESAIVRCNAAHERLTVPSVAPRSEGLLAA